MNMPEGFTTSQNLPVLSPTDIDCVVAVMLKTLDGKCKMSNNEQDMMAALYDSVKQLPGELLVTEIRETIDKARDQMDDALAIAIHELRLDAEQIIPKPMMKRFKKMLRKRGMLPHKDNLPLPNV